MDKENDKETRIVSIFSKKAGDDGDKDELFVTPELLAKEAREALEKIISSGSKNIILISEGKNHFVMESIPDSLFSSYGGIYLMFERMKAAINSDD